MKKSFGLLVLAIIGSLSLSGCNNELDTQQDNNGTCKVKFVTDISSLSRTSINEGSTTTNFTAQDAIGIFAYEGDKTVASNIKYVYDGTKWTSENAIAAQEGVQYKYYAYYPYKEGVTDPTNISVTVNTDQSNGISMDDFLTAQNETSAPGAETISLKFNHAFSMIQVGFDLQEQENESENNITISSVSMENVLTTALINAVTEEVNELSGNVSSIKMEKAKNTDLFRAIVPAQTLRTGTKILSITDGNGIVYDIRHNAELSYKKGEILQITVKSLTPLPNGNQIEITKEIAEWTGNEINDGIAVNEIPLIQPITTNELTEVLSDTRSFNEESWFKLYRSTNDYSLAEFAIVDDTSRDWGKAAKLTFTPTESVKNNSWYIATIGYSHTEAMYITNETYIYKVTAWVKGEAIEDGKGTAASISVTCKSRDAISSGERYKYSFAIGTSPTIEKGTLITIKPTKAATWEEKTFYIDFSRIGSSVSSSTTYEDALESDYNGFDLRFYTNNKNYESTIYISDVKIEQYHE